MSVADVTESLEKIPDLEIAQLKFSLTLPANKDDPYMKAKLLNIIMTNNMAPWYETTCSDLSWNVDENLLLSMKLKNDEELEKLEEGILEAEDSYNDAEVREAHLKKSQYFCTIGDEKNAVATLEQTLQKTVPVNHRVKILFHFIRLGLFFRNYRMILKYLEKADALIDDLEWDLKNRLKVYKGFCYMSVRKFEEAADLLLDSASTFTSYELMSFNDLIKYAVWCGMFSLPRVILKDKVLKSADVQSVFYINKNLEKYVTSLYDCQYADFFSNLAEVELNMIANMFMHPHYRYYVREMKVKAYSQLLNSYSSLSLEHMAGIFGVTAEYIDNDVAKYIAAGKLHCQIDKVAGSVISKRTEEKTDQLTAVIKQGDLLLNRVQNLSRVADV